MTAQDRLRDSISLISPDGDEYTGKWRGNERTMRKKVGQFTFPLVKGTKTQDLDVDGVLYPLTIFFDGPDNDLTADAFFESSKQNGKWEVVHPVFGVLFLQLLDIRDNVQPIESINYREFQTNWIESLPDGSEISLAQLLGLLDTQVIDTNLASAIQFDTRTFSDTFAEAGAIASAVNEVISAVRKNLRIVTNFNIIPAQIEGVIASIEALIAEFPIDTEALAGQVQQLVQLHVLGNDNVIGAIENFITFGTALFGISSTEDNKEALNTVSVQELALSATLGALASSASLNGLETRMQAIENAEDVINFFNDFTDNLDTIQELFETANIESQYFSQSQSYADNYRLAALAAKYLLTSAIDLKIERRFTLKKDRNILDICAAEYNSIEDDILDFFIETNNLKANEIRVLPALKEVAVFV